MSKNEMSEADKKEIAALNEDINKSNHYRYMQFDLEHITEDGMDMLCSWNGRTCVKFSEDTNVAALLKMGIRCTACNVPYHEPHV